MSLKEYEKMDDAQLSEKETELRKHLFTLRTQSVTEKVKDVSQFRKAKKDIARIQTLRRQRELAKNKA